MPTAKSAPPRRSPQQMAAPAPAPMDPWTFRQTYGVMSPDDPAAYELSRARDARTPVAPAPATVRGNVPGPNLAERALGGATTFAVDAMNGVPSTSASPNLGYLDRAWRGPASPEQSVFQYLASYLYPPEGAGVTAVDQARALRASR